MDDLLSWLQRTYMEDFCNGSWEHVHGITIDTLDPGWDFKFDLNETDLEKISFSTDLVKRNEYDWYQCWIENGIFRGWGGPLNLSEILRIFKEWYVTAATIADEAKKEEEE
jgi:hypothetical protein